MIYHGLNASIYAPDRANLSDMSETVRLAIEGLRPRARQYGAIVVSGMSGALVGSPVALALGKPIVVVRKPGDSHHDNKDTVNLSALRVRWIFLDDFMGGGTTLRRAHDVIRKQRPSARFAGAYLYRDQNFKSPADLSFVINYRSREDGPFASEAIGSEAFSVNPVAPPNAYAWKPISGAGSEVSPYVMAA